MDVIIDQSWYERPHGVPDRLSSGGVVCRLADGVVWLALVREKGFARFVLPKGGVQPGESLEAASRREVHEEAGFTELTLLTKLGTCERLSYFKQVWTTTHFYLYVTQQLAGTPTDPEHAYTPVWTPLTQLEHLFWPEQQQLIEMSQHTITALVHAHSAGSG